MKQADSRAPSIGGNYCNAFEGEGLPFAGSTKHSYKLGSPQEKQQLCPTLHTGEWKSAYGSVSKTKNELDDSELQKDNFWIQRSVDYKDKHIPNQLSSQQSKKRGIRVQSNHKFPSDFFSNQICQTETASTDVRQLTSQPAASSNSNTITNRIPQFQTSSHPMKLSLPLPSSDSIRCENEQALTNNEYIPNNKTTMNYSSSRGYLIRQMYPPTTMHQQTQSISSVKNYQQNLHMSINDGQAPILNNNKNLTFLNQPQPQAPGTRILSPNEGSLRMLSPKERPWRILSPKENSSSNIISTPQLRPLRILSPKEHPACMNSPKTSMTPCNQKTILKPQLKQLQQNATEYSSSSLEKEKKTEKLSEQPALYQNQRQNSCMLGLNAKRMVSMIDAKSAEKNTNVAPFSSRPSIQAGMILDRREKLISGGISSNNTTAAGVGNNITNSIVPAISRPNILSAKGNKSNPVDFSNFKMPLSSIGKKIKDFQPPEKSQAMNKTKKNIQQEAQEKQQTTDSSISNEQAPKNLGQSNKRDDSNKFLSPNRFPQLKMHTTNDNTNSPNTNFFSEIISNPRLQMTNTCDEQYETIEEDFQQVEDSQQNTYLQQQQQQNRSEHGQAPLENKTADFSAGWNGNSNSNSSNKKDQPRLAVNSKITEKYKPFLIRQVSSQSSQRAQQSSSVSTNTSATAASLTMFCSDLIKNSDVILKNPSLTAQQQPILNSIECFNSHEFSFSNN